MAKQPTSEVDEATSTGALEVPAEPDSSAQSITAGILADLGDEPLIPEKPKRGRPPKKIKLEELLDDDAPTPEPEPEPVEDEPEVETEQPEVKDDDDDKTEPTELDDQLQALAQNYGVDPELLAGAESVAEAERFIDRMMRVFYREGAAQNGHAQNGHAEHQPTMPAAPNGAVQKKADDALEIDLSKYDDDEPIKSDLQKLIERDKRREAALAELQAEKTRAREDEFRRVQEDAAYQFQNEFFGLSPELFGSAKKQDPRQAQKMRKAFEVADTLIRGYAVSGKPLPSVKAIAKWAVQAEFAEELANQKLLSNRATIQERTKRRSVGAPAQASRNLSSAPKAKGFEGEMTQDPELLAAVKQTLSKTRG